MEALVSLLLPLLHGLRAAEPVLWILSAGYLLWRKLIMRQLEEREISQIQARERPKRTLDRGVLIRDQLLNGLDAVAILLLFYLIFTGILLRASRDSLGAQQLQMYALLFLSFLAVLAFLWELRNALRIRSGKFRLRRYMLSGYQTSRGAKGNTAYTYYMGSSYGDLAVVAPLELRDKGTWFYTVVMDGKAVLALSADRWQLDWSLHPYMPAKDWKKASQDK